MKKSKKSLTPKFKVGETVVVNDHHDYAGYKLIIDSIEPSDEHDGDNGPFWYYHRDEYGFIAKWSENYLRSLTKLEQALV